MLPEHVIKFIEYMGSAFLNHLFSEIQGNPSRQSQWEGLTMLALNSKSFATRGLYSFQEAKTKRATKFVHREFCIEFWLQKTSDHQRQKDEETYFEPIEIGV
jgi:hypothetical protein